MDRSRTTPVCPWRDLLEEALNRGYEIISYKRYKFQAHFPSNLIMAHPLDKLLLVAGSNVWDILEDWEEYVQTARIYGCVQLPPGKTLGFVDAVVDHGQGVYSFLANTGGVFATIEQVRRQGRFIDWHQHTKPLMVYQPEDRESRFKGAQATWDEFVASAPDWVRAFVRP